MHDFFLSSIIHIIIRTIKCFLLWLLTLPSLIFCNNHTFIPGMKQQRRHFIVYMTISLSLSLRKSAWFFLSSIIHIIIRTIKFFFVAFNIVVTITMLFIFCKNHTFIPRMRQQRRHFIVYITISYLSSIIHIKWVIVSQLSLLLFGMLQRRNSLFFHNRSYTTTTADTLNHLRLKAVVLKSPKMLKEFVHS